MSVGGCHLKLSRQRTACSVYTWTRNAPPLPACIDLGTGQRREIPLQDFISTRKLPHIFSAFTHTVWKASNWEFIFKLSQEAEVMHLLSGAIRLHPRPERIPTDKVPRSIYSELTIIKQSRKRVPMSKKKKQQNDRKIRSTKISEHRILCVYYISWNKREGW